jgi:xanthine dehydrogenase FAD-binding subunit
MSAVQDYIAPKSLAEALRLMSAGDATPLAGGTDLMPQCRDGRRPLGATLLGLRQLPELRGIEQTDGGLRIGASSTISDILCSELLIELAPPLPAMADRFASSQVRNSATIGGNICNASPAGDMIIPLLVLDAEAELACWRNGATETRRVPMSEFFLGPGRTVMEPTELLTGCHFDLPAGGFVGVCEKFGARPALDIAVVSLGIGGVLSKGILTNARIACGAVAPVPLRARNAEAAIEGRALDEETIGAAALALAEEISPISDVRASAWYRREIAQTLTKRMLQDVSRKGN